MLVKLDGKATETVVQALTAKALTLPAGLMASLTWDRGHEMCGHRQFTLATDINVYVCDPRSPWQRGSNKNTNGLLRQYFPRGKDLSIHSRKDLDGVAQSVNTRPGQTLGFRTPADILAQAVALTPLRPPAISLKKSGASSWPASARPDLAVQRVGQIHEAAAQPFAPDRPAKADAQAQDTFRKNSPQR